LEIKRLSSKPMKRHCAARGGCSTTSESMASIKARTRARQTVKLP
jgi:hypothetical protein